MTTEPTAAAQAFLRAVARGDTDFPMIGKSNDLFFQALEKNRLGPLAFRLGAAPELAAAYHRSLYRGAQLLRAGAELAQALAANDIPCMAYRGPFAGAALYGDCGARPATDIDLLVPRRDRSRALEIAQAAGYDRRDPYTPRGFELRHYFHWALRRCTDGRLCDLHWAIHHPYQMWRIDYAALFRDAKPVAYDGFQWRSFSPAHQVLVQALHLAREFGGGGPREAWAQGRILPWLDLAVMLRQFGRDLDWSRMEQTALEWRAEIELYSAIKMAAVFFDIGEFGGNLTPQEVKTRPVTANGGLFARIGVPYLCPPARYFGARRGVRRGVRRAAHMVGAAFRLAVGAADAALTSAVVGWRRRRTRGLAWLAIGLSALAAQADDYGNTWRTAQPIAATNIPVAGVIENDYDEDWFCFEGLPETDYVIQLATNTIWDGTLEMLTPFAAAKLAETGTAYGASPASGRWTNAGVRAVFYLRVTPFLEFTTGSYQLVVFPTNAVDSDHDGLLDSWEMRNFNTLTNNGFGDWDGDTFNNADEYHMRTEPTNAASGLFISGWGADSGTNWLAWPAGLYGTYQVAAHTNMRGAAHWIVLTDVYAAATAVITNLPPEPRNRPVRCYRLQFVP